MKWIIETEATIKRFYEVEALDEQGARTALETADVLHEEELNETVESIRPVRPNVIETVKALRAAGLHEGEGK